MNAASAGLKRLLRPLGLFAVRMLPRRVGYFAAEAAMSAVAVRRRSRLFRSVQANQSVVRGLRTEDPRLEESVRQVFLEAGRSYADWFRALALGPGSLPATVRVTPNFQQMLRGGGAVVVGAHVSGFNLILLRLSQEPPGVLLLTRPGLGGIHGLENALRRRFGLAAVPTSLASLRRAVRVLREGGKIITGVDRPDPDGRPLTFFGRRAVLPLGHVRIASRAGVPILVTDILLDGPGQYTLDGTSLEPPPAKGASQARIDSVAEEILRLLEQGIRRRPASWLMFLPVWPPVGA